MIHTFRHFEAADPFDRIWQAEFRWQQTAISIRHADTVDVKWRLTSADQAMEKVVALQHADLLQVARNLGRKVSDPWCMRLAAAHLWKMLGTWQDMDKTLVTLNAAELTEAAQTIEEWEEAGRKDSQLV